jgi:hypothetical protein
MMLQHGCLLLRLHFVPVWSSSMSPLFHLFFYKIKIYCKLIFLNVKNKFLKNNLRPNTPFQSRSCFTQEIMARLSSTPTLSHMDKGRPSASHQNVIQTREFYFSLDLHMVHIIPIHYTHHTRISNRCEWWKW